MSALKEKWTALRDGFLEKSERAQEKLRQFWMNRQPRERIILSILGGMMGVVVAFFIIQAIVVTLFMRSSQLKATLDNAYRIQRVAWELSEQRSRLSQYERLRRKRGNDFKIEEFIQSEAKNAGIKLKQLSPSKATSANAHPQEEFFEIKIEPTITLEATLGFYKTLEDELGVRIHDLTLAPSFADPTRFESSALIGNLKTL